MYRIKWILLLLIAAFFACCKTADIPKPYNFSLKEVRNNPYGCWTEITTNDTFPEQSAWWIKGELLAVETDSLYLLVADGDVRAVHRKTISTAKLYTHKNQANTYLLTTILLGIPGLIGAIAYPEYGGSFLIMAIPATLIGVSHAASENAGKGNVLFYPGKKKLEDFRPFARYPGGMPEMMNYRQLRLKK